MKNIGLIVMALLIVAMAFALKKKSDSVESLTGEVSTRDRELSVLKARMASLDARVATEETQLAAASKKLADQTRGLEQMRADLSVAQTALQAEMARRASLKADEAALRSGGGSSEPSLGGHIQNDNQRLAEIERQLKAIDSGVKDSRARNKVDASAYHAQMKAQIKAIEAQLHDSRAVEKAIAQELKSKQKEKLNLRRDEEAGAIQVRLTQQQALSSQLQQQIAGLHAKESADTSANSLSMSDQAAEASSSREQLLRERDQVRSDLANLNSRNTLVKRDASDVAARVKTLQSQEHDSDVKINDLKSTIDRLQREIAAAGGSAAAGSVRK